jgi:hypothetical protein
MKCEGIFENNLPAGESPGTYSILLSPDLCADVMIAANCEGLNIAGPQIAVDLSFNL